MNRRGFLFGLGATIAIVPAASLMRIIPPKLIAHPPFLRWMPEEEFALLVNPPIVASSNVLEEGINVYAGGFIEIDLARVALAARRIAPIFEPPPAALAERADNLLADMLGKLGRRR